MQFIPVFANNWRTDLIEWALMIWSKILDEIHRILTLPINEFHPNVWQNTIMPIHDMVLGVALGLVGVFFFIQVVHSAASFAELKRPEVMVKILVRLVLTKTVVTYGLDLILSIFSAVQGVIGGIISSGFTKFDGFTAEMIELFNSNVGLWNGMVLFAVALIGSLVIVVCSAMVLLSVYGRFFKIYMHVALSPIPLAGFASTPTQSMGISFLKSFAAVCLEGACIAIACMIYNAFASMSPLQGLSGSTITDMIMNFIVTVVFQMLVLVGAIRLTENVTRSIFGLH